MLPTPVHYQFIAKQEKNIVPFTITSALDPSSNTELTKLKDVILTTCRKLARNGFRNIVITAERTPSKLPSIVWQEGKWANDTVLVKRLAAARA